MTRGLHETALKPGEDKNWRKLDGQLMELHGKTMLVVGLGGIGTQISRRANAFGMRVQAIDPKEMERPAYVFSLDKPAKLMELLPKADVVVIACPLTSETKGLLGEKQFAAMKPTAYIINVARGGIVQTPALEAALKAKKIAGAGLGCGRSRAVAERASILEDVQCGYFAAHRRAIGGGSGTHVAAIPRECASFCQR